MDRNTGASQNCFLATGADHKAVSVGNDICWYYDSEPLMYVCSETSMPPKSAGALPSAEMSALGASPMGSTTSRRKSRKSSTMVYESTESRIRSPRSAGGASLSKDMASAFKSEILSKFKEFAITPNSSCSNPDEHPKRFGVGSVGANSKSRSRENKIENKSQDVEELFIHKTKFFTSSSESNRVRISSEDMEDEEFSTGMSDMDDRAKGTGNIKRKSEELTHVPMGNINTGGLPQWFATKSSTKHEDAKIRSPAARPSPTRIGPPVQGRLSLRTMKTSPPCFCLLDEIRKNNLVMKEDIFSSSSRSQKARGVLNNSAERTGRSRSNVNSKDGVNYRHKLRDMELTILSNKQVLCGSANGKTNATHQQTTSEAVEVYEATGGVDAAANRKPEQIIRQDPVTSEVNEKFKQPVSSNTLENDLRPLGTSGMTSERQFSVQMNNYLEAKTSTPNRRPEKYVKLPGLAEAFIQRDFNDIRIKDGTSFESVNALEEMSTRNIANQILKMKNTKEYEDVSMRNIFDQILELKRGNIPRVEGQVSTQTELETKDAATDLRIPLVNTKTQTGDSNKIMVDCIVQCDSHIVDEANGRNVVGNDHQEIMVCDDNGDGVQLYNELGHPLTDMDGYLLKDSLGRFLVRLDQYGVPVSCTNGQRIFMEDSTAWDAAKNTLSIVHQSRKRPMKRDDAVKKSKARPSLRQLETAMKNLKNTLEWADKISLDSTHEYSSNRFTDSDAGEYSPHKRPPSVAAKLNNTNSLIAEMKSIARLRNALLEKVSFIVDNKNKLGKSKNKFLGNKNTPNNLQEPHNWANPAGIWQGQDRPHSPTYQAIKKLQESESKTEAAWMNFGLTQDLPTPSDGRGKNAESDWMSSVRALSVGDDFQRKNSPGRHQLKTGTDWMNAIPDNTLNANFHAMKLDGNRAIEADLWGSLNHKSQENFRTSKMETNSGKLPISPTNGYRAMEGDLLSEMRLVSKDTEPGVPNLPNVNPKNSAFTGSQLLVSLEKEYNLSFDSWMEPWKNGTPLSVLPDRMEQARKWSELKPSVESSSGSSII